MKLHYKITGSIAFISLFLVWLMVYINSNINYKSALEHEKKSLEAVAIESAKDVKQELLSRLDNVKIMAASPIILKYLKKSNAEFSKRSHESKKEYINQLNKKWMSTYDTEDTFVKQYLNNRLALYLKKIQTTFEGIYGEIFITDLSGAMIASTGKLTTLTHSYKYWWKEAYADGQGKIFFDDRGFDASVDDYVIGIVIPIKEDGKVIGILKANMKVYNILDKLVTFYNSTKNSTLKIVRTKGTVVYEELLPPLSTSINPKILKYLHNKEIGSKDVYNYSQQTLVAYAPIIISSSDDIIFGGRSEVRANFKGNNGEIWNSVVSYNKDIALEWNHKTNMLIISLGLLLSLVNSVIAFYVGRWISRPIEELQETQKELQKQEKIMLVQSRHAAMGEMISMIAHQWRQPLSVIAMGANNIMADIELDTLNERRLEQYAKDILSKTQELSKIIDDFKNFFKPNKEIVSVLVKDVIDDTFLIIGQSLENNGIEVVREFNNLKEIETYPRELMQVIINIVKNAKDAIEEIDAKERKISIYINEKQDNVVIKICDSGGGIKDDIIDKIFNPYFSTKTQNIGTGIGLYMSKTIIEKHLNGTLSAYNLDNGACFEIVLPVSMQKSGEYNE